MHSDIGLIIAIVGSAVAIVGVMMSLFLWNRGEARTDKRDSDDSIDDIRKDLNRILGRLYKLERKK